MTAPPDAGASRISPGVPPVRLRVNDLRVCLLDSRVDVIDEVSFEVTAGEVLGLVGESGSGKTTVAHALLGHARRGLVITGGQVVLDATDLIGLGAAELRALRGAKVAYVPQDPAAALNPALRVGYQLVEALEVHPGSAADPAARVLEVLAEARLDASPELLLRYPHQLSGGQQQRVAIAMAFVCRPSLIVLDEPTTGLDVTTQRHVLDTVRSLCAAYGVAAVYVSHDLAVVAGLAQQVAVMYAGRVVELGTTGQVFGAPLHPYTRGLLAAIPSGRAEVLAGIDGQPPWPGRRPAGCSFAPRCPLCQPVCTRAPPPPVTVEDRVVRCVRAEESAAIGGVRRPTLAPPQRLASAQVLTVRGLTAAYGTTEVLSDVDLEVAGEQCVAVVGESGSGKTTLTRCIVGLHANWRGELRFSGELLPAGVPARPREVLRRIQYVFQSPYTSLNPRKTIGQIVAQPLEHFFDLPRAERERRVRAVLSQVSLGPDLLLRYPDQLSGGERQRVAIARALVVEPELLVCDEVTSSLDVSVQAVIVELLRRLQAERSLSMLFITHNLALASSIAQSCVVFAAGRVVERGPVEEVLQHPRDPYTVRLTQDLPKLGNAAAGTGSEFLTTRL